MEEQDVVWKILKKTKQRELIRQILSGSGEPMCAAEIYQRMLGFEGGKEYAISTVYRTLQTFEEKGLVHHTSLPDSDTAYYEWNEGIHRHYAICLSCHKRIPLKECPFHTLQLEEEKEGFQVTGHKVEVYGYCSKCQKLKQPE